jgi:hypothetical protein
MEPSCNSVNLYRLFFPLNLWLVIIAISFWLNFCHTWSLKNKLNYNVIKQMNSQKISTRKSLKREIKYGEDSGLRGCDARPSFCITRGPKGSA